LFFFFTKQFRTFGFFKTEKILIYLLSFRNAIYYPYYSLSQEKIFSEKSIMNSYNNQARNQQKRIKKERKKEKDRSEREMMRGSAFDISILVLDWFSRA